MALRKIVTLPDPVLKRKAHTVTKFDKNLQTLIDDMIETMRLAPGVGLAAPQIGFSERIIVIEYLKMKRMKTRKTPPKKVWAMLNPEIIKSSEETLLGVEGCLSIPNLVGEVERHAGSTSEGIEPSWQTHEDQSEGLAGAHLPA